MLQPIVTNKNIDLRIGLQKSLGSGNSLFRNKKSERSWIFYKKRFVSDNIRITDC